MSPFPRSAVGNIASHFLAQKRQSEHHRDHDINDHGDQQQHHLQRRWHYQKQELEPLDPMP
ncbi:hypothetical protein RRF57_013350 [Xylaria bambusicola]|uniref:Uncharacterized protein n=1 Tax=Xylaria bambusicola TaxID=326684 RepID=A0AAN7URL3_9PEZI